MTALIREGFPLYCCGTLDDQHVVVAGGGGAAKTGVPNAIVSWSLLACYHTDTSYRFTLPCILIWVSDIFTPQFALQIALRKKCKI